MFVEKIAAEVITRLPLTCKRWEPSAHEESCNYYSLFTSRRPFIWIESSSLSLEFFSQAQNAEKRQRNSIRAIWQTPWQSTCILATIKMASWTVLTKNIKLSIIKSTLHQWNMSSENTSSNTISGDIFLDRLTKIVLLLKSKLEQIVRKKVNSRLDLTWNYGWGLKCGSTMEGWVFVGRVSGEWGWLNIPCLLVAFYSCLRHSA